MRDDVFDSIIHPVVILMFRVVLVITIVLQFFKLTGKL
jgi:hypothetical protein